MPLGPGKYDKECTLVRESAEAAGAAIIVLHGKAGNGFSVQMPPVLLPTLPSLLRTMADQIEASYGKS
jgi:hypothetical protein